MPNEDIRRIMKYNKVSQQMIANKLNVHCETVGRWLRQENLDLRKKAEIVNTIELIKMEHKNV